MQVELQFRLQSEHPLVSEVPLQVVEHPDEHAAVQSVHSSLVQLVNIAGNALVMVSMPIIGNAFLAVSLKNSLLLCKSLFCIFIVIVL